MAYYVSIFTKKEHLDRGNMAISADKMSMLISGKAEVLIHRAYDSNGPIIYVYSGEELRRLLGRAVRNGHTVFNAEKNRDEVAYFLARFTDPGNRYSQPIGATEEECDCEEPCEECTCKNPTGVIPF